MEQTIYPERLTNKLLDEEAIRWFGEDPKYRRPVLGSITFEEQEWSIADCIVCGSEFVRGGLIQLGVPDEKIAVVPYGVAPEQFPANSMVFSETVASNAQRPIRLLLAGRGGLRKGVPDFLQSLTLLKVGTYEARLAGQIDQEISKLSNISASVQFMGDVPRSSMAELYQWADALVCPSIAEGSATVTYEALMSGLPVIATPNSGSQVRDGIDGFIVPVRDPHTLAQTISRYWNEPELLLAHKLAAKRDRLRLGLDRYRDNLVAVVKRLGESTGRIPA